MNRALLDRVMNGDAEAIEQFGNSDHCAVIDWKDDLDAVVAAVADFPSEQLLGGRSTR